MSEEDEERERLEREKREGEIQVGVEELQREIVGGRRWVLVLMELRVVLRQAQAVIWKKK